MLAQIGVKRFRAGLGKQRLEHQVAAAALRKMIAIGFSQCRDACVAVLLVDAAGRIAVPTIQTLPGFLAGLWPSAPLRVSERGSLPRSPNSV